jgi:hypothetical protein
MTETDRTVQVPVSMPTREHIAALRLPPREGFVIPITHFNDAIDAVLALFPGEDDLALAKPPRIEDMAPGTTFTEEVRWTVTGTLSTGSTVAHSGSGEMRFADRFDPSTIRDVTPPKDAP